VANGTIDKTTLCNFLRRKALPSELDGLAEILKCNLAKDKGKHATEIVKRLYLSYQTPVGYLIRKPTLDAICDRIAKKLKLEILEGRGWQKLHSLSINIFEKVLKSMSKKEKEKLLKQMWHLLDIKDRKQIKDEFHIADMNSFIHSSELLAAHVVGIHLARETALYTAATILRLSIGSELALAASTVLTRTATVLLGPVGWALLFVSINDLMGTNYKKVVPALLTLNVINMRVHKKVLRKFPFKQP